jgi:large subunit ribosomal protein L9
MEVILLEQIDRLGKLGDTVKVKPGFARNYLIPQKKALRATEQNVAVFAERRAQIEKENQAKAKEAEGLAKKVEKKIVVLLMQAGEDGRLFGSVNARAIAKALSDKINDDVDHRTVSLQEPIKYLGVHPVQLKLGGGVKTSAFVNVARSESEAEEAEKEFLNPTAKAEKKEEAAEGEAKPAKGKKKAAPKGEEAEAAAPEGDEAAA